MEIVRYLGLGGTSEEHNSACTVESSDASQEKGPSIGLELSQGCVL